MKIVPKDCQGENPKFEGFVEIEPLGFDEAMNVLIDSGVNPSQLSGEANSSNQLKTLVAMVKASKAKYKKVELKRLSDGKEFKSIDEIWVDSSCRSILSDVASQLFSDEPLGN